MLAPRTRRSTVKKPERAARVVRPEIRPAIGETPGGSTAPTDGSVEASTSARRGAEAEPAAPAEADGAEDEAGMSRGSDTRGMHGPQDKSGEAETRGMHEALTGPHKKN